MRDDDDYAKQFEDKVFGDAQVFGRYNRLQTILSKEKDDRGYVLLAAAYAEEALGRLIEAYLIEGSDAHALLHGFNAPLGTLSARIGASFALGLLSETQRDDLNRLRKVRNEFAHQWENLSSDTPAIADRMKAMSKSRLLPEGEEAPLDARERFRQSIGCVLLELQIVTNQIVERRSRLRSRALHVSLTPPP